jgi:ElaA protein
VELIWDERTFDGLDVHVLYRILALRQRVFVVEQACAYLDADGADQVSRHVWAERDGAIVAYARIVPAGVKYDEVAIGRVIIAPEVRGAGLGRELMRRAISSAGPVAIRLSAQAHLEKFYAELGFVRSSDIYDEDGIPHVEMLRVSAG